MAILHILIYNYYGAISGEIKCQIQEHQQKVF